MVENKGLEMEMDMKRVRKGKKGKEKKGEGKKINQRKTRKTNQLRRGAEWSPLAANGFA